MFKELQIILKRRLHRIIRLKPFTLFLAVSLINALLFLILMPFLGEHGFNWVVMENNSDFESADYFLCILFSLGKKDVYRFGVDACYSPLSYAFFYCISKITSTDKLLQGLDLLSIPYEDLIDMTPKLLTSPYQLLTFIIYSVAGIALYIFAIGELNLEKWKGYLLSLMVLTSVPLMFGAVERGNLTMYVAAMVLLALVFKDSSSPVKRELALLLIAAAAGLKFYPAFMGILYLKEKRFKEAGRLILYGILFVFVPFVFFGGVDGIIELLNSLSSLAIQNNYRCRIQFFKGIIMTFGISGMIGNLLNTGFICILIIFMLVTGNKTRMMVYLAAALAFYPPNAYRYTLLFFLLPLFTWAVEEAEKCSSSNYVKAFLFSSIFSIPTLWGIITHFRLSFGYYTLTYVEFFIYLAAWGLLGFTILEDITEVVIWYRSKTCKVKRSGITG